MGFWSSFFGAGAAHVYNEMKKEGKETQKWNDLFHEMMECESAFNEYLKSVGIIDSYCADVEYVNSGNIMPIKRDLENLREKVNNYISLGGLGVCVRSLESLDDDLGKVKYLKKVGKLERQVEFAYDDMRTVKDKIEAEQEEIEYQQERLREEQQEQRRQEINNIVGTDINSLSGEEFELICQKLVENMGFETETTKASGDGGIDLIAYNHQPLLSGKYLIQCKRYSGSVGEPIIRDLYGVVMSERANKGILMTTGYFANSAITFAEGKPIELIDGVAMQNLFSQYGISVVSSNNINTKLGVERVLNEKVREFFDEKWNEFETSYYTFGACLDDLVDTADLREKVNVLDTVISGLKLFESYLMASKMPCEIQAEMFVKIIGIMDIGKYESCEAEKIYSAMIVNDDGLRDNIKKAVIPSEDYTAGMFWTYLVAASDEMQDYSYIKDLLQYHSKYIIALACCIRCFTDNDVFGDLRNYCEETHNLLEVYLSTK